MHCSGDVVEGLLSTIEEYISTYPLSDLFSIEENERGPA